MSTLSAARRRFARRSNIEQLTASRKNVSCHDPQPKIHRSRTLLYQLWQICGRPEVKFFLSLVSALQTLYRLFGVQWGVLNENLYCSSLKAWRHLPINTSRRLCSIPTWDRCRPINIHPRQQATTHHIRCPAHRALSIRLNKFIEIQWVSHINIFLRGRRKRQRIIESLTFMRHKSRRFQLQCLCCHNRTIRVSDVLSVARHLPKRGRTEDLRLTE